MTNKDILGIAMSQSALELNCSAADFLLNGNKVVLSAATLDARAYLKPPLYCALVSYGHNIAASVNPEIADAVSSYINAFPLEHCFEPPNMYVLNDALEKRGRRVSMVSEYFLPDVDVLKPLPCDYEVRMLNPLDFDGLYTSDWHHALTLRRPQLDVLGAGAYDGRRLVGLAACSADCASMWQVGIDVLTEYRQFGIASALTSRLAIEILERGKVPFYSSAWSNLGSVRNAIKSGFRPAWIELECAGIGEVADVNRIDTRTGGGSSEEN
jgi:hypothetical protein